MDQVTFALLSRQINTLGGTGIVSGLRVRAQNPPDMTVTVRGGETYNGPDRYFLPGPAGLLFTPEGKLLQVQGVESIPLPESDPDQSKVALVYVTADGQIDVAVGTNLRYPVAQPDDDPIVPAGGTPLAYVDIPPGTTEITDANIRDVRLFCRLTRALSQEHVLYYDEGVEYVDWVQGVSVLSNATEDTQCEVSKQPDHLRVYVRRRSYGNAQVSIVTDQPVDLDGISRIWVEFGLAGWGLGTENGSSFHISVGTKTGTFDREYVARLTHGPTGIYLSPFRRGGVLALDVSGVSGKHHIRIHARDETSSSVSRWTDLRIFRVWGERA